MDIRKTEKIIWGKIWQDLAPTSEDNDLYQHIKNYFIDMGYMRTEAMEKRFEEGIDIVLQKIWKMTPPEWRKEI